MAKAIAKPPSFQDEEMREVFAEGMAYRFAKGSSLGDDRLKVVPMTEDEIRKHLQKVKDSDGTDLKVVDVVNANTQPAYSPELLGDEFYITFTAVAKESGETSHYQAKVLEPFSYPNEPILVFFIRPKPT